ncbi:hypothetical protein MRB53_023554 [Persea americana]|uniref:Uncharacterized protein n=1 Tax=Persea americana TaxID=3435 RepID=A0ACC2LAK2_PERAE|nr:hypothetical protein MRB53_023554 [Persea americana]
MDIFYRECPKRFPGIAFSRFINEVFISTRGNDEVIFDDKAGYALLEQLSLAGKIMSIGPGDDPLPCYYGKIVFLDSDSKTATGGRGCSGNASERACPSLLSTISRTDLYAG